MAITWRNVESNLGFRDAGMLLRTAQDSFNESTSSLADILKQYQQTNDYNYGVQKENNTNAYLDRVNSYRTPEELEAARKSGELDQLRQQFGGLIDSSKIRGAEDARFQSLQDSLLRNNEVEDSVRTRNERGIKDELLSAIYSGDEGKYRQLKDSHELLNEGELDKLWSEAARQRAQDERATRQDQRAQIQLGMQQTRFGWERENQDDLRLRREAERTANDLLTKSLSERERSLQRTQEGHMSLAGDFAAQGVRISNGAPDFSNIPEERRPAIEQAYAEEAQRRGLVGLPSDTQFRQNLVSSLSQIRGLSPDRVVQLGDSATDLFTRRNAMAPGDEALAAQLQQRLEADYEQRLKEDPYTQTEYNPDAAATKLLESTFSADWDPDGIGGADRKRRELFSSVRNALDKGIPVTEGGSERIAIPMELARIALVGVADDSGKYEDFEKNVRKLLENPGVLEQVKRAQNVHSQYMTDRDDVKRQVRVQAGLPANSVLDLDRALQRRLERGN